MQSLVQLFYLTRLCARYDLCNCQLRELTSQACLATCVYQPRARYDFCLHICRLIHHDSGLSFLFA